MTVPLGGLSRAWIEPRPVIGRKLLPSGPIAKVLKLSRLGNALLKFETNASSPPSLVKIECTAVVEAWVKFVNRTDGVGFWASIR